MEIFFSFFLFPIFHTPSAREILRKQKELEKYFSYCTLHHAITSTYLRYLVHQMLPMSEYKSHMHVDLSCSRERNESNALVNIVTFELLRWGVLAG